MRPFSAKSQNTNSSFQKLNSIIPIHKPEKIELDSHDKFLQNPLLISPVQSANNNMNTTSLNLNGNPLMIIASLPNNTITKLKSESVLPIRISKYH